MGAPKFGSAIPKPSAPYGPPKWLGIPDELVEGEGGAMAGTSTGISAADPAPVVYRDAWPDPRIGRMAAAASRLRKALDNFNDEKSSEPFASWMSKLPWGFWQRVPGPMLAGDGPIAMKVRDAWAEFIAATEPDPDPDPEPEAGSVAT